MDDRSLGFSSLAPLTRFSSYAFIPFARLNERASSRDVPMMEPPPHKGGPLRGQPRNGGAAPAAGGGRILRARAAPGYRSPALRPAARSSLMVSATHPAFKGGSAARSAARRRDDAASWRAVRRGASGNGCAPQGKAALFGAPHPLVGGFRNAKGTTGEPGASTNNTDDAAWLFDNRRGQEAQPASS